jgi:hypothetical protein
LTINELRSGRRISRTRVLSAGRFDLRVIPTGRVAYEPNSPDGAP